MGERRLASVITLHFRMGNYVVIGKEYRGYRGTAQQYTSG
jgi:hypothetical protein